MQLPAPLAPKPFSCRRVDRRKERKSEKSNKDNPVLQGNDSTAVFVLREVLSTIFVVFLLIVSFRGVTRACGRHRRVGNVA